MKCYALAHFLQMIRCLPFLLGMVCPHAVDPIYASQTWIFKHTLLNERRMTTLSCFFVRGTVLCPTEGSTKSTYASSMTNTPYRMESTPSSCHWRMLPCIIRTTSIVLDACTAFLRNRIPFGPFCTVFNCCGFNFHQCKICGGQRQASMKHFLCHQKTSWMGPICGITCAFRFAFGCLIGNFPMTAPTECILIPTKSLIQSSTTWSGGNNDKLGDLEDW